MRDIKFRAWNGDTMRGVGKRDYFSIRSDGLLSMQIPDVEFEIPLMQFTGLTDKNGVDIYEGDIVKVLFTDWPSKSQDDDRNLDDYLDSLTKIFTVKFHDLAFQLAWPSRYVEGDTDYTNLWCGRHGYIEVIGNIHQNKNLIDSN